MASQLGVQPHSPNDGTPALPPGRVVVVVFFIHHPAKACLGNLKFTGAITTALVNTLELISFSQQDLRDCSFSFYKLKNLTSDFFGAIGSF